MSAPDDSSDGIGDDDTAGLGSEGGVRTEEDVPFLERVAANPRPATVWVVAGALLLLPESPAILQTGVEILQVLVNIIPTDPLAPVVLAADRFTADLPALLSRQTIPNRGYWNGERYVGTFLGMTPAHAWLLRTVIVYVYSFAVLAWVWSGYKRYREHYRQADWTPRDDMIDRFRNHAWGKLGFFTVFFFVVMAVFAPTVSPTTVESNILFPYSNYVQYWNADAQTVENVSVGVANLGSGSEGASSNVGVWEYDDYGRFHPVGTTPGGKDMMTELAHGARVSLSIGVVSMGLAGFIALGLAMASAYYKGVADLLVVVTSDSIQALPVLMILILVVVVFQGTPLAELYDGAILLMGIFVLTSWPFLWRAIRGPALQVSEEEWIDAAKSYGQHPAVIMRRHMAPYVIGYLLVYTSMSLGGIIISIAGLSYLGLGINPPTPEWGRIIAVGQSYVATQSWHISLVPGIMITALVVGFNALGDGIRDAIDPYAGGSSTEDETAAEGATGGGSGA